MTVTPRVSMVAFEDRAPSFIFVAVPDERGRYVRTDRSVALVACSQCNSAIGEPCKGMGQGGYNGNTHFCRRISASGFRNYRADDVLEIEALPLEEFI